MKKQPNVKKSKLSYLALGIAAIATLATGGPLITSVQNLDVYENTIYADVLVFFTALMAEKHGRKLNPIFPHK